MRADQHVVLLVLGAAVATMPVFAIRARSRAPDPDIAGRSASILIGRWLRNWLVWLSSPLERALVAAAVSPTALNVLGAVFGAVAGVAFSQGQLTVAGASILAGGLADVLDGRVARARGVASVRGAFLDSTLDRFSESFTFIGLIVFSGREPAMLLLASAALGGSMLVSYTRARGEGLGVSVTSGLMQRTERLVLLAFGALADPLASGSEFAAPGRTLSAMLLVIAVGSYATALHRSALIARALDRATNQNAREDAS